MHAQGWSPDSSAVGCQKYVPLICTNPISRHPSYVWHTRGMARFTVLDWELYSAHRPDLPNMLELHLVLGTPMPHPYTAPTSPDPPPRRILQPLQLLPPV